MADDGSVISKAVEKLSGALEKLVDNRMLVLGVSLVLYWDIWMIWFNADIGSISLDGALAKLKFLSIRTMIIFVVIYSMLMTVVIPAARYLYSWGHLYYGEPRSSAEPRTVEERRLSDWALAVLVFYIWDWCAGCLKPAGQYDGLAIFVFEGLSSNDVLTTVFRICVAFFLWFCLMMALEKDY